MADLGCRTRSVDERPKDPAGEVQFFRDDVLEHVVEVGSENPVGREAEPFYVLRGGEGWIDLLKIARNASCHREDVYDFAGGDPLCLVTPKRDALRQGQLPYDDVQRTSAEERSVIDDVLPDPTGNTATENDNELVVFLPIAIPADSDDIGESRVVMSEPGYLVDQDYGALAAANALIELDECLCPVFRNFKAFACLRYELIVENPEFGFIGEVLLGPDALKVNEP